MISRIGEIRGMVDVSYDPDDDVQWNRRIVLRLRAHPGLDEAQRRAIERDFAMEDGCREIETRLSMAYYYIQRMNLDLPDLDPRRVQLRLENLAEVGHAVQEAKAEARARIAERGSG